MSKQQGKASPATETAPLPPQPVDVVDGIPDRSRSTGVWKYVIIAMIFAAWMALLVYCQLAGR